MKFDMDILLQETKMLDYSSPQILGLIRERRWNELDDFNKIKQIYNYVRDEIKFGYNIVTQFLLRKC